jgi:hypothetical protein
MAWPGLGLVLQWVACLALLGWAVWFLSARLALEFSPRKAPGCHSCPGCEPKPASGQTQCSGGCGEATAPPAAKLKTR